MESADGTKRVELSGQDSLASLYEKTFAQFKIDSSHRREYSLYADRARTSRIVDCRNTRARETVSHGDLVYLLPTLENNDQQQQQQKSAFDQDAYGESEEDQVDIELIKQDGKIHRKRDEQL